MVYRLFRPVHSQKCFIRLRKLSIRAMTPSQVSHRCLRQNLLSGLSLSRVSCAYKFDAEAYFSPNGRKNAAKYI